MTFKELQLIRLKNDYEQMLRIKDTSVISWEVTKGTIPYVQEYTLFINLRSFVNASETHNNWVVVVTLPEKYPHTPPCFKMISSPVIFHPDLYTGSRRWSFGGYSPQKSLLQHIHYMLLSMVYECETIGYMSPCNTESAKWYIENLDSGLFPTEDVGNINKLFKPSETRSEIIGIQQA